MREMALFAVIRIVLWGGIWWVLSLFDIGLMLAGVLAALIAMLISILFLNRFRHKAALRWKAVDDRRRERRGEQVDEDAAEEDALLDAAGEAAGHEDSSVAGPAELPELTSDDDRMDPDQDPLEGPAQALRRTER